MSEQKKNPGWFALLLICIIIGSSFAWSVFEHFTLRKLLQEVYESDGDFEGISAEVRYGGFLNKKELIFDLKKVPRPDKMTPFIYFVEFSKKLSGRNFERVLLQYRGKTKYILDGLDFSGLGTKSQISKIEQIAMEFPPTLKKADGLPAFEAPYGDEQWVIQKQMKNFRDFLSGWYIDDWVAEAKVTGKKVDFEPQSSAGEGKAGEKETSPSPVSTQEIPEIEIESTPLDTPSDTPVEKSPGEMESPLIEPE